MIRKVPETTRLEIKFVAYEVEAAHIAGWLRMHSAGFFTPYPDRWVNNVYFDTHRYFAYSENLSGSSYRSKLRYRWYGSQEFPDSGTLEVKCKRNYYGWKLRFQASRALGSDGDYWNDIRRNLIEQLEPAARKWVEAYPQPVIINRYYRQYYISRDERIRATIDVRQAMYDQRYKPYPNLIHRANIPNVMVLEFKFDRKDSRRASQILQGVPLRVSRNSKYMTGVKAIHGY